MTRLGDVAFDQVRGEHFRRRAHRTRLHGYAIVAVALVAFLIALAASNTAHVKVFKDVSPDSNGTLHLGFTQIQSVPFLNAIEIEPVAR